MALRPPQVAQIATVTLASGIVVAAGATYVAALGAPANVGSSTLATDLTIAAGTRLTVSRSGRPAGTFYLLATAQTGEFTGTSLNSVSLGIRKNGGAFVAGPTVGGKMNGVFTNLYSFIDALSIANADYFEVVYTDGGGNDSSFNGIRLEIGFIPTATARR